MSGVPISGARTLSAPSNSVASQIVHVGNSPSKQNSTDVTPVKHSLSKDRSPNGTPPTPAANHNTNAHRLGVLNPNRLVDTGGGIRVPEYAMQEYSPHFDYASASMTFENPNTPGVRSPSSYNSDIDSSAPSPYNSSPYVDRKEEDKGEGCDEIIDMNETAVITLHRLMQNDDNVRILDLSNVHFAQPFWKEFANCLNHNTKVSELYLNNCEISDRSLVTIIGAISSSTSSIRTLSLADNRIRNVGLSAFARLFRKTPKYGRSHAGMLGVCIGTKGLVKLNLRGNEIRGSEGVKFLSQALVESCVGLQLLNLAHNDIDDYGAGFLAIILRNNNLLRCLDLRGNIRVQYDGAQELSLACQISRSNLLYCYGHDHVVRVAGRRNVAVYIDAPGENCARNMKKCLADVSGVPIQALDDFGDGQEDSLYDDEFGEYRTPRKGYNKDSGDTSDTYDYGSTSSSRTPGYNSSSSSRSRAYNTKSSSRSKTSGNNMSSSSRSGYITGETGYTTGGYTTGETEYTTGGYTTMMDFAKDCDGRSIFSTGRASSTTVFSNASARFSNTGSQFYNNPTMVGKNSRLPFSKADQINLSAAAFKKGTTVSQKPVAIMKKNSITGEWEPVNSMIDRGSAKISITGDSYIGNTNTSANYRPSSSNISGRYCRHNSRRNVNVKIKADEVMGNVNTFEKESCLTMGRTRLRYKPSHNYFFGGRKFADLFPPSTSVLRSKSADPNSHSKNFRKVANGKAALNLGTTSKPGMGTQFRKKDGKLKLNGYGSDTTATTGRSLIKGNTTGTSLYESPSDLELTTTWNTECNSAGYTTGGTGFTSDPLMDTTGTSLWETGQSTWETTGQSTWETTGESTWETTGQSTWETTGQSTWEATGESDSTMQGVEQFYCKGVKGVNSQRVKKGPGSWPDTSAASTQYISVTEPSSMLQNSANLSSMLQGSIQKEYDKSEFNDKIQYTTYDHERYTPVSEQKQLGALHSDSASTASPLSSRQNSHNPVTSRQNSYNPVTSRQNSYNPVSSRQNSYQNRYGPVGDIETSGADGTGETSTAVTSAAQSAIASQMASAAQSGATTPVGITPRPVHDPRQPVETSDIPAELQGHGRTKRSRSVVFSEHDEEVQFLSK